MRLRYGSRGRRPAWAGLALGACLLLAFARPASADLFELGLKIHVGGIGGLNGGDADPLSNRMDEVSGADFFQLRRGAMFGGTLEIEVLYIDIVYEFYQLVNGDGLSSTLNNIMAGFDWTFEVGGDKKWIVEPYLLAGIGFATQDSSWLAKKYPQIALDDLESRMVQVRVGIRVARRLGRFFRIGIEAGFGYHYGIENTTAAANKLETHYHGFHYMGQIYLAFHWQPFNKKKKKKLDRPKGPMEFQPPPGAGGTQPGGTQPGGTQPGGTQPGGTPPGTTPPGTTPPSTTPRTTTPPPAPPPRKKKTGTGP